MCALWSLLPALVQGRLVQLACCCPNTLGMPVLELLTGTLHCCPLASASERYVWLWCGVTVMNEAMI